MQKRYVKDVLQSGFSRESSAAFCIPDSFDEKRLVDTLCCAVYHAIGLRVLNASIDRKIALKEAAKETEGIGLMIIDADIDSLDGVDASEYSINGNPSYPYVKVKEIEDALSESKEFFVLPEKYMDMCLYEETGEIPRFFQKINGKKQFLYNCNMDAVWKICRSGAEYFKKYLERG
jgi:hypothetical protein